MLEKEKRAQPGSKRVKTYKESSTKRPLGEEVICGFAIVLMLVIFCTLHYLKEVVFI